MKKHPKADSLTKRALDSFGEIKQVHTTTLKTVDPTQSPEPECFALGEQERQTVAQADNELLKAKLSLADSAMQVRAAEEQVQARQDKLFELCRAMMVSRGIATDGSQGNWILQIDQGKLVKQI